MAHDVEHETPILIPKPENISDATQSDQKESFFGNLLNNLPKKIGATAAALALGAGGLYVAYGIGAGQSRADKDPTPSIGASAVPGATESVSTTPSASTETQASQTTSPEVVTNGVEVLKQTVTIEAMDAMTTEDFSKLSYADRYAYAIAKLGSGGPIQYTPERDTAAANKKYIPGYWSNILALSWQQADPEVAAKTGSVIFASTSADGKMDARYAAFVKNLRDSKGPNVANPTTISTQYKYVSSTPIKQGLGTEGKQTEVVELNFNTVGVSTGKVEANNTARVIKIMVETLDGKKYVMYPMDTVQ